MLRSFDISTSRNLLRQQLQLVQSLRSSILVEDYLVDDSQSVKPNEGGLKDCDTTARGPYLALLTMWVIE